MRMKIFVSVILIILAIFGMVSIYTTKLPPPIAEIPLTKPEVHDHKPGQFGGFIVPIGSDNYHAEFILSRKTTITMHLLNKDETKTYKINQQVIFCWIKKEDSESVRFALMPKPMEEEKDQISRWEGTLPEDFIGENFTLTFTIVIEGDRFRSTAEFKSPIKPDTQADKDLYLKPGGIYTEQDIEANGNKTASQKFKGFVPKHDLLPKKGDRICPITLTKANPACAWTVNGKEYWFCCPPCVFEFVKMAKEHPESIKNPEEYVK
jgi:YHS domain-containing protein